MKNRYIWDNVRVLGGAYGGSVGFSSQTGRLFFSSYRDPNVLETLTIFDSAADSLLESEVTQKQIEETVIGCIGDLDAPMSSDQKGLMGMQRYLIGASNEQRYRNRREVLGTSIADVQEFGKLMMQMKKDVCVFGSKSALEQANKDLPAEIV